MKKIISFLLIICTIVSVTACSENFIVRIPPAVTTDTVETEKRDAEASSPTTEVETVVPETTTPVRETFDVKLSFAGDMLLASFKNETKYYNFNDFVNKNPSSYFLEKVRHIFEADDFTVVNLENVFTDRELVEIEKDYEPAYWYRTKTSNIEILTSSSVEAVSLANNHTEDYGAEGFEDTLNTVKTAGLYYGTAYETMYLEKEGFTVAVICTGLWSQYQTQYVQYYLDAAKEKSDFQVVFFHGGTERIHEPEDWKINACRQLVDGGADLIIGGHPHVLQPMETYNGVDIIYSIGNFCFGDGYKPENRTIIYQTTLTVDRETMELAEKNSEVIPCYVWTGERNNYQPAVIENEAERERVLSFMRWECDSPVEE